MVEHLPSMGKALVLLPSTANKQIETNSRVAIHPLCSFKLSGRLLGNRILSLPLSIPVKGSAWHTVGTLVNELNVAKDSEVQTEGHTVSNWIP